MHQVHHFVNLHAIVMMKNINECMAQKSLFKKFDCFIGILICLYKIIGLVTILLVYIDVFVP